MTKNGLGVCSKALLAIYFIFWLLLVSETAHSSSTKTKQPTDTSTIFGAWIVTEVLDLAPILPIDESTVNSLPGKVLTISGETARFIEYKCDSPTLKYNTIQTAKFFSEYRMDSPKGLPKLVKTFTLVCAGRDAFELSPMIIHRKSLLLIWRGALLELKRR